MSIRPIVTFPDPSLRKPSLAVERVDDDLRRLVKDMFDTMYDAPGIGLAGVQIGVPRRILVVDTAREPEEEKRPIAMINPEIVWHGDTPRMYEEGCLSIPEMYAEVERPGAVRVTYLDVDGQPRELLCENLLATVVQHELDHLDGILFIDHLSRLKRDRLVRRFLKAQKDREATV
ncbi:MAG: peptide deformylase [Rhizobiales bacterium]|nr:peptide deformylase [Hyphomicrobiales bacterium]